MHARSNALPLWQFFWAHVINILYIVSLLLVPLLCREWKTEISYTLDMDEEFIVNMQVGHSKSAVNAFRQKCG